MTLEAQWVRCGRAAAERLREAVTGAKGGDPLAPVTVVVPSNHVGVAARRLLASGELGPVCPAGAGMAAVTFLTVYRLAELLGASRLAAAGRRPVSTPVIAAAARAVLDEDPGVFRPVAGHPATEVALVAAYQELRDLPPDALDRLAACSERAADVVRVHRAVRLRLEPLFSDEEDLMEAAVATTGDLGARWELGPLVVYLPLLLSRHAAALLGAVGARTRVLVLAGATGDAKADAEVRRSVGMLDPGAAAAYPGEAGALPTFVGSTSTRVVTTSDADEEVRAAVRAIVDRARGGTPLERIAVLYGTREPYARIVHEQLDLAGIAHNGAAVVPLTARVAGRTLLGLLGLPANDFRREDVFAWLSGARVRHRGRNVPVTAWERLSREAGVVAGRDQWDRLLAAHADDLLARAELRAADPEVPEWLVRRAEEDATRATELRQFVLELIDDLAVAALPRSWRAHAEWARTLLRTILGPETRLSQWPLVERKAFERTTRAIDRLAGLADVEGPVGLDVFQRTLELELGADLGRVGRMGEGVLVGSVRMGVGLDLDLVICLGMAEGSFPAPVREDSLLPDDERAEARGELPLAAEETERQHYELLASLSGASRHLLCLPRGDLRRSNERVPSRWVDDIASELAGRAVTGDELLRLRAPWLGHVASYDAGLRATPNPATEQEYRLRALLARSATAAGSDDPVLACGAELAAARHSGSFTRFDGNLSGLSVPSPAGGVTSATRLEMWAGCPFAYYVREILKVEPVENPEDRLRISPLDLGSLIHEVLERFVAEVLARPRETQPGPDERWTEADRRLLLEIASHACHRYEARGLVGRPIFWRRDRRRTLADLERLLDQDSDNRAARRTRPVAAELAFGMGTEGLGSVELGLPDGRSVSFRGKADRLDAAEDGSLEVVDYKTGRPDQYAGLSEADPAAGGRRLQLAVYALAARAYAGRPDAPVRSDYWFATTRGGFKRKGYAVTADVLARVGTTVGQMLAGIEAGVFPNYPTAVSTTPYVDCHYCDPDGLGVADLRRQLERKRGDPALRIFLDLAEGASAGQEDEEDEDEVPDPDGAPRSDD